jgi:cell division protein ZapA
MSTVTLSIGPKSYTVACGDGEEAQIEALGAMITERYAKLGPARGPLEAQNLLFTGLFLADELSEARRVLAEAEAAAAATAAPEPDSAALDKAQATIARLQGELAAARAAAAQPAPEPAPQPAPPLAQFDMFGAAQTDQPGLADQLEALAAKLEASAAALEATPASA